MAEDKEVLRYCEKCEYVYLLRFCNREIRIATNKFTGTKKEHVAHYRTETNSEGKCPHYKPKLTLWQRLKQWWWKRGPDYKEKVK